MQKYNIPNIRHLLNDGFTDKELRRVCYDDPAFRSVYDQLAANTGKAELIDRLIEFAEQKLLVEILLDKAQAHNPRRFKKYEPYFDGKPARASLADDSRSLRAELAQHQRNLNILREHAAIFAAGETPLHLINQIDAEKATIEKIKARLKKTQEK